MDRAESAEHAEMSSLAATAAADPVRHARPRRDTPTLLVLDIAGRWEPTGLRAPRADLVSTFVQEFGQVLTDVAGENPERISDPKY